MSDEILILRPEHATQIIEFERAALAAKVSDPMERELQSWHAPWREESLTHYLSLGWSFGLWRESKLAAYALAQPFLFFRGLTQSLWVEHVSAAKDEDARTLLDVLVKWSRDKHLQRLLVNEGSRFQLEPWKADIGTLDTAKLRGPG